jgi:alpha-tubulin suppressor-like RCC1 family protein
VNSTNWPTGRSGGLLLALALLLNLIHGLGLSQPAHAQTRPAGTVVGWGWNHVGQLDIPAGLNDIVAVSASQITSLALRSNGTVIGWGSNVTGQLDVPAGLNNVTAIAAGSVHSMALKSDGTVVTWGCGPGYDYGQCTVPPDLSSVVAIAAGEFHSLALKSNGTIVAWGCGGGYDFRQCTVPATLNGTATAITAGSTHSAAIRNDGRAIAWGDNRQDQSTVPVGADSGVVAIAAAGSDHTLALKSDGTVVAWGWSECGQTTVPAGLTGVVDIATGYEHSVALKSDGTVVTWGGNSYGQTSVPAGLAAVIDIAAGWHTLAIVPLSSDPPTITPNIVGTQGDNSWYTGDVSVAWTVTPNGAAVSSQTGCTTQNVTSDTSGVTFTCSATSINGGNSSQSVTIKRDATPPTISAAATSSPNAAGWYNSDVNVAFSCADALAGTATCAANQVLSSEGAAVSSTAQFATDRAGNTSAASNIVTVKIDKTAPVVSVTGVTNGANYPAGAAPTAGCTTSDALSGVATQATPLVSGNATGAGLFIAMCRGATDAAGNSGSARAVYSVALAPGAATGWGYNSAGQLNIPDNLGTVIGVAGGGNHSVALKADGTVAAWGLNNVGQSSVPSGLSDVVAIAAGTFHSLALKRDGTVVAWGGNGSGQSNVPAGLSDVVAIAAGWQNSLALKSDGSVVGWGMNNYGQSTAPAGLSDVIAVDGGYEHSLALKADGTVVAWGRSDFDQISVPAGLNNVVAIAAGDYHSLALKRDGTVVAWGANYRGQRTVPTGLSNVVAIAAGGDQSLALKDNGTVVAWGDNAYGQGSVPGGLDHVVAITGGAFHNLVIREVVTVTINQAVGQNDPTDSNPVRFEVVFSEPVTNFAPGDVTLSGTADRAGATVTISGGPAAYTVMVDGLAGNGTVIASLAANVVTTASGKANLASTSTDNSVTVNFDSTPPVITPSVAGTLGSNGWYTSDVTVNWSVVDNESMISAQNGCASSSVTSDTSGVTFTCTATSAGGTASQSVTIKRDATAPTITAVASSTPNAAGWYNGDVTVAFSCADALSGIAGGACPASQILSAEGTAVSSTAETVSDRAGNTSAPSTIVTVKIDKTAPVVSVTGVTNGASYPLGSVPTAGCSTTDTLSGVATSASLSVSGSGVGSYSATCSGASDTAGNNGAASVSYQVIYAWSGFFQPVDNLPTINTVKAGQAIPVKFSLGGNYGLSIFAAGYPASQPVVCSSGAPLEEIEQTVTAGSSSLQYDTATGQYIYVWKTEKAWAGQCRLLTVRLNDGTNHTAMFKFR